MEVIKKTYYVGESKPKFGKLETVPPMCPLGFQLILKFSRKGPISPTYGKRRANWKLDIVPPWKLTLWWYSF